MSNKKIKLVFQFLHQCKMFILTSKWNGFYLYDMIFVKYMIHLVMNIAFTIKSLTHPLISITHAHPHHTPTPIWIAYFLFITGKYHKLATLQLMCLKFCSQIERTLLSFVKSSHSRINKPDEEKIVSKYMTLDSYVLLQFAPGNDVRSDSVFSSLKLSWFEYVSSNISLADWQRGNGPLLLKSTLPDGRF